MNAVPRCGRIAIIGRPNVGKSTLLNRLVGQKISITSRKPQTTLRRILGISTVDAVQMIFVDTPGWQRRPQKQLNRLMNRQIDAALADVDVVVLVVEARGWQDEDDKVLALAKELNRPVILVLNKHDRVSDKTSLLPLIAAAQTRHEFAEILPANAVKGDNVDTLRDTLAALVPEGPHVFPEDSITDHSERFLVAELLREKLIRGLGDELPYSVTVIIENFTDLPERTDIDAQIWVEKEGQKGIVIGAKGERLKAIATAARKDIEALLQRPVYLRSWVKTKGKWADDRVALQELDLGD